VKEAGESVRTFTGGPHSGPYSAQEPEQRRGPGGLPPEQLVDNILGKERRIIEIMEEIKGELAGAIQ